MIESTQTKVSYKIGSNTVFPFPFKFFEPEDIKVKVNGNLIKQGVDYDVERKESYQNGSNVILKSVYDSKADIVIFRELPIKQLTDLPEFGKLSAEAIENEFDRIIMICQELQEQLSHTLIYDGEEEIDYADLMQKLVAIQEYIQNAEQLSSAVTKAAVSAAQSLISAIEARQYRDAAKDYADAAAADSDIATHNNYNEAHPFIRELISGLDLILQQHLEAYGTHIEDYEKHITDNANAHQTFTNDIKQLDDRVVILENASSLGKGNMYYTFGLNNKGQIGVNWTANVTAAPIEHFAMRNVSAVSISGVCGTAISGGRIYVTGNGGNGLCGPDRQACYGFKVHPSVDNIYNFVDIVCFDETAFALDNNGKLYSWGKGSLHCLGDGTTIDRSVPRNIMPDIKFKKIAAGCRVMLALSEDGKIYSCGSSGYGALGHAVASETSALLKQISGLDNIIDIAAGGFTSEGKYLNFCAAIQQNEGEPVSLYTWGYNGYGQLGFGNTVSLSAPQIVEVDFEPAKISCGAAHLAIISKEGKIYIAGAKGALQSAANQTTFKLIESDDIYTDIAAGRDVTYMLTSYKHIYGMGVATNGALLGQKSTALPVELVQGNIEAIYSGCQHYGCAFTIAEETDND